MLRFALHFNHLLTLWVVACTISKAQPSPFFKLQPERFQQAKKTEKEALLIKDSLLLAEAWYLYGKTYASAGDYQTSQGYFLKSLGIQERRGDSFELGRLYVRLSENESRQSNNQEALRYANLSTDVFQRIHSDEGLVRSYGALGKIYTNTWNGKLTGSRSRYDTILFCYKKVESLAYKLNDTLAMAESAIQLGHLFTISKDPKAVLYLKKAVYLFAQVEKDISSAHALMMLVPVYLNAGQFKSAFQALTGAEQFYIDKKINEFDTRIILETYYVLYFQTTGEWKKAFEHLKKLSSLENSRISADRNGAISRLKIEYETEKKEKLVKAQKLEIKLRNEALENQQRFTMATMIFSILAVIASIIFFKLSRKNQRISYKNEELLKEQNHRVKNNLQVISSLLNLQSKRLLDKAAKKAVQESRLRIESMAIVHRRLYDGDHLAEVELDEFVREIVQGVLRSFGYPQIQPDFHIDTGYLTADKAVPMGLIINELTTNACKYAFPNSVLPKLTIHCRRLKNKIELTVKDNGPGLDGAGLDNLEVVQDDTLLDIQKGSFGMSLIQSQVVQLNGTSRFVSTGESSGTVFTMEFEV